MSRFIFVDWAICYPNLFCFLGTTDIDVVSLKLLWLFIMCYCNNGRLLRLPDLISSAHWLSNCLCYWYWSSKKNTSSEGESRQTILDWDTTKIQHCKRHLSPQRTNLNFVGLICYLTVYFYHVHKQAVAIVRLLWFGTQIKLRQIVKIRISKSIDWTSGWLKWMHQVHSIDIAFWN